MQLKSFVTRFAQKRLFVSEKLPVTRRRLLCVVVIIQRRAIVGIVLKGILLLGGRGRGRVTFGVLRGMRGR